MTRTRRYKQHHKKTKKTRHGRHKKNFRKNRTRHHKNKGKKHARTRHRRGGKPYEGDIYIIETQTDPAGNTVLGVDGPEEGFYTTIISKEKAEDSPSGQQTRHDLYPRFTLGSEGGEHTPIYKNVILRRQSWGRSNNGIKFSRLVNPSPSRPGQGSGGGGGGGYGTGGDGSGF